MDSGIYKLDFSDNSFYIGRSVNIYSRYTKHVSLLKQGANGCKKLQNKYTQLKEIPSMSVLEKCSVDVLSVREEYWIKEYNAQKDGLNILPGGEDILYGENSPNSKYTNEQVLEIVYLLGEGSGATLENISNSTGVTVSAIRDIISGRTHSWVKNQYPEIYQKMKDAAASRKANSLKNLNPSANRKTLVYPKVVSPEGIVYEIDTLSAFCSKHNLTAPNLSKVLKGERPHHKGWKLECK